MLKKSFCALTGLVAAGFLALYLLTIPLLRRLPTQKRVCMEGITTVQDAISACQNTRLVGWDLVTYAQQLTARKFTYSRLNAWDTPSRAFARGRGYCQQQALALKKLYDGLGIKATPVYALRCTFPPAVIDGMPTPERTVPHTWLKVTLGETTADVCPHAVKNTPGVVDFKVCSPVHPLCLWLRPFTHLGSVVVNLARDRAARNTLKKAGRVAPRSREIATDW